MKEFQKMKEKISDNKNLIMMKEKKTKNIENLQNDNKTLLFTLEQIQKKLNSEKDKSISILIKESVKLKENILKTERINSLNEIESQILMASCIKYICEQ